MMKLNDVHCYQLGLISSRCLLVLGHRKKGR